MWWSLLLLFFSSMLHAVELNQLPMRKKLVDSANLWLDQYAISYAWGGANIGAKSQCEACNSCLEKAGPNPKMQLEVCPVCKHCSLDCSHFISSVYQAADLAAPYLTTSMMRSFTKEKLVKLQWLDLGRRAERALPGDILVYNGHVVLVESLQKPGVGSVIHVTSGREVKGPGEGIQRQTNVEFDGFRGRLERVLRHKQLQIEWQAALKAHSRIRKPVP